MAIKKQEILNHALDRYLITFLDNRSLISFASVNSSCLRAALPELKKRRQLIKIEAYDSFSIFYTSSLYYACGANYNGQLGFGDKESRHSLTRVENSYGIIKRIVAHWNYVFMLTEQDMYICGFDQGSESNFVNKSRNNFIRVENLPGKVEQIFIGGKILILTNAGLFELKDARDPRDFIKVENLPGAIQQVFGGKRTIFIRTDQGLYTYGDNSYGQLGLEILGYTFNFTQVKSLPVTIKKIFGGGFNNFALTDEGHLYACGVNSHGQLSLGDTKDRHVFTEIKNLPGKVKHVATSAAHTFLLTDQGLLYACGNNAYGQLGLGDDKNRSTFTPVNSPSKVEQVAVGSDHTILLTKQGLYSCGANSYGQLGLGHFRSWTFFSMMKGLVGIGNSNDYQTFTALKNIPPEVTQSITQSLFFNHQVKKLKKLHLTLEEKNHRIKANQENKSLIPHSTF